MLTNSIDETMKFSYDENASRREVLFPGIID